MKPIALIPFGDVPEEVLTDLAAGLTNVFGLPVRREPAFADPAYAFDEKSGQFSCMPIMTELLRRRPMDAERVIGVTTHDLFIPMLSFVFGLAQLSGPVCVISTARLHQSFYRLPENRDLLRHRVLKEAVHELGHTFGLVHCEERNCAMSLANTIQHVDHKRADLCPACMTNFESYITSNTLTNTVEVPQ